MMSADEEFLDGLPLFLQFEDVANPTLYRALPDGWALALADINDSTGAIDAGRYKAVNMAGAGVISGVLNALQRHDLPFVFGGDGAAIAVPPSQIEAAREALSKVQSWVTDDIGLSLRAAIVPISAIRENGFDVRVARFRASDDISYAMFTGGGNHWADEQMKQGNYLVEAAGSGSRPDLTGLSCRWNPIQATHGTVVSIIAVPRHVDDIAAFRTLVSQIVALANEDGRGGHPVPADGPPLGFIKEGLAMEARALSAYGDRLSQLRKGAWVLFQTILIAVLYRLKKPVGRFDPVEYKRAVASNTDFRKFDDGLKMTVDVDPKRLDRIKARLEDAAGEGICYFGLHEQDTALMTCIVPSPLSKDHMHFVDGGDGGYAKAAASLKAQMQAIA
ncbi:DUF3095 domain-containing protein [Agrobacterium rubi]|uniref:DUF3095 domain-containing protein n=1 Tax=Agrobacterium rubi TaxID=28099 RepID=A0AAE7QZR3_9HYPH|nr:DUF3095 domain-containing protein [Agrobacterium rubi]NTE87010.1 DUF3095 domain-containing protein [Agrobacterium rubi]NTF02944.1 DUF3095 domain-containing protein [Agrobacterium rubi]NTF37188.1 DUF3095 domain-containing protein [Agrobacterium rubi]OCJ55238.1 adenylate cyclase [Agrobacterium rubi]QTF99614.1 DUF3095 domain-containing protein [Agrobacterium rubi]